MTVDDRVALADLALGDDAREPLPVVADRDVGGAGRTAASDAPRLRDALDDPPRLGVGQGEARGAMRQAERLADLALRERDAPNHQVGVDPPDRRRHAPGRAHVAPGVGELEAQRLGWRDRVPTRRNVRLDGSVFLCHNLLANGSTEHPTMTQATIRPSISAQHSTDAGVRRGSRLFGALVAMVIAASVAIVTSPLFESFLSIGIPGATLLGWLLGPSVRTDESIDGPVMTMAILTIPLALVVFIATSASATSSVTSVLFVALYGLLYIGIPMLFVTVPCAIAWAKVVRRLARGATEVAAP